MVCYVSPRSFVSVVTGLLFFLMYLTSTFGLNVALCIGWLTSSAVHRVGACSHGAGAGGASAQGRGLGAETLIACVSS